MVGAASQIFELHRSLLVVELVFSFLKVCNNVKLKE